MTFDELLESMLGGADALSDINVSVRKLWYYDFRGYGLRLWDGRGKLYTEDGYEWLGTVDAAGNNHHDTPAIQDGRDGSSATYTFGLRIPEIPGQNKLQLYQDIKADQAIVSGRSLYCYLAIFAEGEALRPATPISFFKKLTMFSPKFTEGVERDAAGTMIRVYKVSVPAKDANYGRSNTPNGTYADTIQKRRAQERGVALDRGAEFIAALSNRTYQIP